MRASFIGLGATAIAVAAVACGMTPPTSSPTPLKQGSLDYYAKNCEHCHGPGGNAYGPTFFARTDLPALRQEVSDMCEGPGQAPLDGRELKAQTAFHVALILHSPFLTWTESKGSNLAGEVFPANAKVTASSDEGPISVTAKDGQWKVQLPSGTDINAVQLTAVSGSLTAKLALSKGAWSTPEPQLLLKQFSVKPEATL